MLANRSMADRFFYNADGEMLIVPQQGTARARDRARPARRANRSEIAVIPRGVRFRVELPDGEARGYICENYGALFQLPDLGPIGSNGLANPRDFLTPVAGYEDREGDFELVAKFQGNLWRAPIDHSPLDVVAWHGNYAPYKYDLRALQHRSARSASIIPTRRSSPCCTSPSDTPGVANIDFVIFPAALDGGGEHLPAALVPSQRR